MSHQLQAQILFHHILFQHFSEFPFFSSRTLFIGNLEKTSTYEDLKRTFFKYGKILKIELKKVGGMDFLLNFNSHNISGKHRKTVI